MAEENTLEQTNDQMMSDFFSLDNLDTSLDLNLGGDSQKPANNQQQQSQSATNATNATNHNQQPNQTPAQPSASGNQQPNQQQTPPKGFEQNFFKDDGKGNQVFDVNAALNQLFNPQNDRSFQYQNVPNYHQQVNQSQQQPAQPLQPEVPAWKKEFDEIQSRRDNYVKNLTSYKDFLIEGLNAGYQGQAAFDYATQKINSLVDAELRRYEFESRAKREEENVKRQKEIQEQQQILPRAQTNRLAHYQQLGGQDKFDQLIFGVQDQSGKLVGGYGTDVINMLFDMSFEGKEKPADIKKAYVDFWDKICAHPARLQFVVDVARSRLRDSVFPHIANTIRSNKETEIQQRSRAQQMPLSQIQNSHSQGELDPLGQYLGQDWRTFDTV